jgi:hypothetical protein
MGDVSVNDRTLSVPANSPFEISMVYGIISTIRCRKCGAYVDVDPRESFDQVVFERKVVRVDHYCGTGSFGINPEALTEEEAVELGYEDEFRRHRDLIERSYIASGDADTKA